MMSQWYPAALALLSLGALGAFALLPARLKLVLVSALLPFLLLEAALRMDDAYARYRYRTETDEALLWEHDPLLGWKMKAGGEAYFSSIQDRFRNAVQTNSKGLRDDEYPYEKPEGTQRILLLGDSVIAGFEVEKTQVIDRQLERLLNRTGPYEVINAGVRGYSTDQAYLFLREEGLNYQPDIVIYVFVDNDLPGNVSIHRHKRKFGKPYFVFDERQNLLLKGVPVPERFTPHDRWLMSRQDVEGFYNAAMSHMDGADPHGAEQRSLLGQVKYALWTHSFAYRWVIRRIRQAPPLLKLFSAWGLMAVEPDETKEMPPQKPASVVQYEWDVTQRLIQEMAQLCRSQGAAFLVYEFTSVGSPEGTPTELETACQEFGVPYIESFKAFYVRSKGERVFRFSFDGHWNARGHALAAEVIGEYLTKKMKNFLVFDKR